MRRPARAWFGLALRLDLLTAADLLSHDPALAALAAGARILSIEAQLRAQTLERWASLDDFDRESIRRSPPSFSENLPLDDTALLHRDQETDPAHIGPGLNVRFLFDTLFEATAREAGTRFDLLAGVTPLGWSAALIALLTAAMRTQPSPELHAARSAIEGVAANLLESSDDSVDAPWDDLAPIIRELTVEKLEHFFIASTLLDAATRTVIEQHESEFFSLRPDPRTGIVKILTDSGSHQFPSWRISFAGLPGERQGGVEQRLKGERFVFRWSQTIENDRLLALGVVQPHLARLGDLESFDSYSPQQASQPQRDLLFGPAPVVSPSQPDAAWFTAPILPLDEAAPPQTTSPKPSESSPPPSTSLHRSADPLNEIERWQERSWSSRADKAKRHARVAFFQWDLDETYRHPLFDACLRGSPKWPPLKHPEKWNEPGEIVSCAEHRRRALLKAVIRACRHFKVDILLLPEYSIRPETAEWIRRRLIEDAPGTSAWAGTYRQPPAMRLRIAEDTEQPPAWSAVMPVILAPGPGKPEWSVQLRMKKYPAVAAGEVFHPRTFQLEPEFQALSALFDPRGYTNELICSEVFLVTSPANLPGMIHAFQNLLIDFGESAIPLSTEELEKHLLQDVRSFAYSTSLSDAPDQPRLLLLVPAMTTRSVDYSILGQASFLASAVTTVFCNAVAGRYGCGESCIIGHDGWGKEGKAGAGMPGPGPYHGALPGIYHPEHFNSGRLGKKEQALVIADIDPVYSPEGKPRPQMLPPPLSLVAHLPIIESSVPRKGDEDCRCQQRTERTAKIREFASDLLESFANQSRLNTGEDQSPQDLAAAIEKLEGFVRTSEEYGDQQSGWLKERRNAYLHEHAASPRQWPPPVALDWLFADISEPPQGFPKLESPPYSLAPREHPRRRAPEVHD
ncbi:MAG: hypothetical protein EOP84_08595 [Verrucomicrobiaceae bacterium]|nr:MAG: hypothetical protein EOP84_08595 [Verrucomicrobiaceae bacterium]